MREAILFLYAYGNNETFTIRIYAPIVKQHQCIFAFIVSGYDNTVFFEIRDRKDGVALVLG